MLQCASASFGFIFCFAHYSVAPQLKSPSSMSQGTIEQAVHSQEIDKSKTALRYCTALRSSAAGLDQAPTPSNSRTISLTGITTFRTTGSVTQNITPATSSHSKQEYWSIAFAMRGRGQFSAVIKGPNISTHQTKTRDCSPPTFLHQQDPAVNSASTKSLPWL